jgi:hypothetical protein
MQTHIVLVTCGRDRDLVRLLLQSLDRFWQGRPHITVINNDRDQNLVRLWRSQLKAYPDRWDWQVIDRTEFDLEWLDLPRPPQPLRWWQEQETHRRRVEGWVNQQQLKYAATTLLPQEVGDYLVLDSQNFLIRAWQPPETARTPYRLGPWSMHRDLWDNYSRHFRLGSEPPEVMQSLCTPIFVNKPILDQMLQDQGGLRAWSQWFVGHGGRMCSEFLSLWGYAQSRNIWDRYYEPVPDWARCYLRDSPNFAQDVDCFLKDLDIEVAAQSWASVNHRAWQMLDQLQLDKVKDRLNQLGLTANVDYLRNQWPLDEQPEPPTRINTL